MSPDPGREPAPAASGRQVHLRAGVLTATVTEVGASLRELAADGEPLIASYGEGEIAEFAHGQALVPWPNRVAGGAYEFGGEELQLPLTEPDPGNAIHGLGRWVPWEIREAEPTSARLALVVHPQAGYPFRLEVEVTYLLSPAGLAVQTIARNVGSRPLPYGCGFHPYLFVGTDRLDDAVLELPGGIWLPVDDAGIPTGERAAVDGGPYDFRSPRAIGTTELDTAFGDLRRDAEGRATVTLRGGKRSVSLWMDAAHPYVMAFTADDLPEPGRRRALGVEPMTCAPNALRTGDGLRILAPGESFASAWGIVPSRGLK